MDKFIKMIHIVISPTKANELHKFGKVAAFIPSQQLIEINVDGVPPEHFFCIVNSRWKCTGEMLSIDTTDVPIKMRSGKYFIAFTKL